MTDNIRIKSQLKKKKERKGKKEEDPLSIKKHFQEVFVI